MKIPTFMLAGFLIAASAAPSWALPKQTAVLAGGCFWGMESVFEHVKGVGNVVSGYAGGTRRGFGSYSGERSDFAEAVRITFDPGVVSYDQLLQIFFDVAHDPTQVNRQGPDIGSRYRSAIFPQNPEQREAARRVMAQVMKSGHYPSHIATRLETGSFDIAESDQQDFVKKHPSAPYVLINDLPKLAALKRRYPQYWRD